MFKQLVFWLKWLAGCEPVEPKIEFPDEAWEKMFTLATFCKGMSLGPIEIEHFDIKLELFSDTATELFIRMEMLIRCMQSFGDPPDVWSERRREVETISIVDYYFDTRHGYRSPQSVMDSLLQKVAVIHHLLEEKQLVKSHAYYPYMKREFFSIIADANAVLSASERLLKK